ncbi:MAG: hypothetical protein JXR78_06070 [Victivallales bacterium]|nr:hypothetical protein [Victivallales bacterium]
MNKIKILYFNSSHWDREWYQPFQHFRMYLIDMAEELLLTLERDPEFKVFCFDGQTVVLEDILEVHPEWRERLNCLISSGRLRVGPWYVQPDEFLVSGEALIKNLELGCLQARQAGGAPWPIGYLCDTFGHIAQMPQILKGFDIECSAVWRGVPPDTGMFFRWIAPDGSECLTARLPERQGYGDFAGQVTGFWNKALSENEFKTKAGNYVDELLKQSQVPVLLLMDGVDHAPVHAAAPQYLRWLKELYPDAEVNFSDLTSLKNDLEPDRHDLPKIHGELIGTARESGGFMHLITHTLSSYYPLKKANDECQTELELRLSPIIAWSSVHGYRLDEKLLELAWKYLLRNQAHDSICGCSVDQVHRDMAYRFDQVSEICEALRSEFLICDRNDYTDSDIKDECHDISGGVSNIVPNGKNGVLTVRFFNSLPYDYEVVKNFEVVFPCEYSKTYAEPFGYETINSFELKDCDGSTIPYGITGIERNKVKRFYRYDSRQYNCYRITAALKLQAFGWTEYSIEPSARPVRHFTSLMSKPQCAENALLRLEIKADGSITVIDKRNQRVYSDLNRFVADAEIGDGWNHVAPKGSPLTYSSGTPAVIRMTEDSPDRTSFSMEQTLTLPEELVYAGTLQEKYRGIAASEHIVQVKILSTVTLDADSPLLKFSSKIDNRARDYRLRLRVPTDISGDYFAHQAFCFQTRSEGRSSGDLTADWKEAEALEKNFGEIAGKRDNKGGIAFFSRGGLHEVSAPADESTELLITFLRAFRRTVATNGETQCQLPGILEYNYALYFLTPEESMGELYRHCQIYRVDADYYTASKSSESLTTNNSMVKIDSRDVIISLIRRSEKGLLIRLVNFSSTEANAKLRFSNPPSDGGIVNFSGETTKELIFDHQYLSIDVSGHAIVNLEVNI